MTPLSATPDGLVVHDDGTVSDIHHGLMWQQSDDGVRRSQAEAFQYCAALSLDGFADSTIREYNLRALRTSPIIASQFM